MHKCSVTDATTVDFDTFCDVVLPLMEEEDFEAVREELKTAFRLYDREGESTQRSFSTQLFSTLLS